MDRFLALSARSPREAGAHRELRNLDGKDGAARAFLDSFVGGDEAVPVLASKPGRPSLSTAKGPGHGDVTPLPEVASTRERTRVVDGLDPEATAWFVPAEGLVEAGEGAAPERGVRVEIHDRVRDRVFEEVQHLLDRVQLGREEASVRFRLHPPALGEVAVHLRMRDRKVELRLDAHSSEVGRILESNAPRLEAVLAQRGYVLGSFDVSVSGQRGERRWEGGTKPDRSVHDAGAVGGTAEVEPVRRRVLTRARVNLWV
jgi:hypothetical protein